LWFVSAWSLSSLGRENDFGISADFLKNEQEEKMRGREN